MNRVHFLRKCALLTGVSVGLASVLTNTAPNVMAATVATLAAANNTATNMTYSTSNTVPSTSDTNSNSSSNIIDSSSSNSNSSSSNTDSSTSVENSGTGNTDAGSGSATTGTLNDLGTNTSLLSLDEQKILEIFQYIYQYHMDPVTEDKLTQGAIDGMLQATGDPYTTYFSDSEYQQFVDSLDQKFVGIGIYLKQADANFVVSDVVSGGPAKQAGIQAGDILATINGQGIQGKSLDDVRSLLLGQAGTKVTVSVIHAGQKQPVAVAITRAQLQMPTVESKLTPEHLGYIQMADFSETSADEFKQALKDLLAQGAKGFIIDLRGNPGGLLQQAVEIANQFVKSGVILKTSESDGESQTYTADGSGTALTQPVVILVDSNSASAAEALSGSLQALHRAILVGTRTFGKGTMQIGFPLATGGVLKLTIGKYYLPNGFNPNHTGIEPNISILNPDLQYNEAVQLLDSNRKQTLQYSTNLLTTQLNGVDVQAPQLITSKGTAYLPLRYTLEAFGWSTDWNANKQAITCEQAPLNQEANQAAANQGTSSEQRVVTNTAYTAKGQTHALLHPLLMKAGMAYMSLNDFKAVFPFKVQTSGQSVTVTQP